MTDTGTGLPIEAVRGELARALARGPAVVTAPTGSGKSTMVPRWCAEDGRVLVVEPRRVACRGLAQRVAELEGERLGQGVGYAVRDDDRTGPGTRIVFATPGVVLRWLAGGGPVGFSTVILDELHERSLEVDLLLALFLRRHRGRLAAMSATVDAERVARHLGGEHVRTEGRAHPVTVRHVPGRALLPDPRGLEDRIAEALGIARGDPGDALVFLPGKAEIARVAERIEPSFEGEVLRIHGGLTLAEQSRVFRPGRSRRAILATNVAETSITIPGIRTVIDSGLVRRTRYVNGRGFLAMVPVALDSAEQRAGRAGRTAPGACYRLWSPEAVLDPITSPEIHRESLAPLVLAAAACSENLGDLPFLDPPKDYAIAAARENLAVLGALDGGGRITERGRHLFGLPVDAALGSLLVEAEREGCLEEAIDLVSALSGGRPLFATPAARERGGDPRECGCDGVAHVLAVREGRPSGPWCNRHALEEALAARRRLRKAWNLPARSSDAPPAIRRNGLVRAALESDPRCACVARRRKGRVFWGNGSGAEMEISRESAVDGNEAEAIAVLASSALGMGYRSKRIYATCAMPVTLSDLAAAGLGRDRLERVTVEGGAAVARIERTYAGRVIEVREEVPEGALAREAIGALLASGRAFPEEMAEARRRLEAAALTRRLRLAGIRPSDIDEGDWAGVDSIPDADGWIATRLSDLGVESGRDLTLLSSGDLLPPDLPAETRAWVDREFPRTLGLGDGEYAISYDLERREAVLDKVSGRRSGPPSPATIPALPGFRVKVRHHSRVWVIRGD